MRVPGLQRFRFDKLAIFRVFWCVPHQALNRFRCFQVCCWYDDQTMVTPPHPSKGPPTLKTIAYMTGLGISTVSRALKDGPEISIATRARVKLIAGQIGYRPNRAGVRLRTGRTNVISVVLNPGEDGAGFFSAFVYGISEVLADTPYHLVVTPYSLADPMAPVRYIVETGSADGVILSRTQPDDPRVRYLMKHRLPFATHGRTEMGLVHPFHDFDNEAFAARAVAMLAAKGRQRIALLGPPPGLTYHRHTHLGFERGLREAGIEGRLALSLDTDAVLSEIRACFRDLARQPDRPDGIICSAVRAAYGVAAGLTDCGLSIGRDADIVTKHSTELLTMLRPEIMAVPEDFNAAGQDCARMVMAWIGGSEPASLQHLIAP